MCPSHDFFHGSFYLNCCHVKKMTHMLVFSGDVNVIMQITFLTRKSALIYRRGLRQRVAVLTLDCNGVFAIKTYASRRWRASRTPVLLVRCTDATRSWTRPRLSVSLSQQQFNCHASFPTSFATDLHEEAFWKHTRLFIFYSSFFTWVSAHMRQSVPERRKHRAGNFHQWNASRMCRTNTCASRPISASAL